ncbi:MAG: hypothetical protein V1808_04900, partial [Candidatus Daviesbacteria bacterium]
MVGIVKDSLAKKDIEGARTMLNQIKGAVMNLGDPLQSKLVPQEIKDKYDPEDQFIKKDRVNPNVMEYYLQVIELQKALMLVK